MAVSDPSSQRGMALMVVLWTALLVAMLSATTLASVRNLTLIAIADDQRLREQIALRNGLAAAGRFTRMSRRGVNPLPAEVQVGDISVSLSLSPEMHKTDPNLAPESDLREAFVEAGLDAERATEIAKFLINRRTGRDGARKGRAFLSVGEVRILLQQRFDDIALPSAIFTMWGQANKSEVKLQKIGPRQLTIRPSINDPLPKK